MKTTSFVRVLTALVLGISLLAAACAPQAQPPEPQPAAPSAPEAPAAPSEQPAPSEGGGGTVVLLIPEEPPTLNLYLTNASVIEQTADATSTTSLSDINEKGEFVPALAEAIPTVENGGLSADYLTVTWKLKPGLKWSDGTPLTADDVKFTYEAISNPASGAVFAEGFDLIESLETPDERTVVIHYRQPFTGYARQFAYGIFPRHAAGTPETMTTWEWNRKPVSAGPFVVSEWKAGESITMERNPYYYETGKPYLERLIFRVVPESAAQTAMMKTGEAHVHLWPAENEAEYNQLLEGIAAQKLVPGIWNTAIDFNLSMPFDKQLGAEPPHPILGDVRVRRAISHAIDYKTLAYDVIQNVDVSTSPFAYGWYQCDIPRVYDYDPEKARTLLEEAGWVMGSDGIRVAKGAKYAKDGTRLSLELLSYTWEVMQKAQEFLAENLKEVGVELRIQAIDQAVMFGSMADGSPILLGDFDLSLFDRGFSIEPHGYIYRRYASDQIPSEDDPSKDNFMRWVNAEADAAIQEAGSTFDFAKRQQAYCRLGKAIVEDVPQIYLFLFKDGYGFSNKLSGYTLNTWGSMTWDVQNWKLAE
ncbi:MAG: peptide ABC transporter substrate-binding protein [Anaerolineae bacterium]|nr:peptide ABC transporter substrate-binding protein [Anaerolineae bacterium]